MRTRSIIAEAWGALVFNRQRSILTMVSLAWGVVCFVVLYSYGEGFNTALSSSFKAVGQDLILMFGGQTSAQAGGERSGRIIRIEREDVDAIRGSVPMVGAISPEVLMRNTVVTREYRSQNMTIRGVLPVDYQKVRQGRREAVRGNSSGEREDHDQWDAVRGQRCFEKQSSDIELQHAG
jgi:putative ABC transport system permease protein